jgi:hypothetical protein
MEKVIQFKRFFIGCHNPEIKFSSPHKLIETYASGGGFVLASGVQVDEWNPDNLRPLMDAAKGHGIYRLLALILNQQMQFTWFRVEARPTC